MSYPLYVSYYTIGNGYELEAAGLLRTLKAFRLPHIVTGIRHVPGGAPWTWQRATLYKAEFVREMQHAYPDLPLVWIDSDARVVQRPQMFDWLLCDVAAHWYRNREMLAGTLFFAPGKTSKAVVTAWIQRNCARPDRRRAEQSNLMDVLHAWSGLRIVNLPPEYAWIDAGAGDDLSARAYGRRHPVIQHRQASRRLKRRT
jgi:hypothetical protein